MHDFPTGLSYDEAIAIVAQVAAAHRLETESLALARCHGRILAQDVDAPLALPPFDNSAMDGYAFRHADLGAEGARLRLAGEQFAGAALAPALEPGQCLRITTGAPLPAGADTVAIKENVQLDGDFVRIPAGIAAGAHVRYAGEDVRAGDRVLHAGQALTPTRVSLAASLGLPSLSVARRPTVAVFTTGDELVEPGLPLGPGQIHDSNRELLMGLLRADGLEPTAWPRLPDDPRQVEIALRDAACAFDLVFTCGAVSAGEKDHVPAVLAQFGRTHFWKVRMKPGMPLLFGSLDQARLLGLPGNPVSVMATYLSFGRALIDGLQGCSEPRPRWRARLVGGIDKTHARREFVRARLSAGEDGGLLADPNPATGSHRLRAAADSNALIVIGEGPQTLQAGAVVEVLPY
ncbi:MULTISPECIES: gephyrin-like molybdotransferase Glp [unclassified Lysobacter]|uniref:molybdopterin molybdotransferase MoeA n=1 Tax=unclassified Lysobacter TaxID=2635362 RepID=UPI0006F7CEEC|nr:MULTISPECIES: gephyrin-like molybdotransferase Glp [unclassified Lysobacter]KQZ57761.1 molybdopterin biosynthesis protein [Lysobacter sp. Root559]KRC33909.1 molybdopterin biosynthesis protein [Lysobacter sp. Root76]KRD69244.1 molybdopterin biosynthesis protein [Lysobacter sp. Root96]